MSDTPRCDEIDYKAPEECGVHYLHLLCLARTLERELATEKARGDRLEKALRDAREAMRRHDDADFQCESVAGAEGARDCVAVLDAALGDSNG